MEDFLSGGRTSELVRVSLGVAGPLEWWQWDTASSSGDGDDTESPAGD